MKRNRNNKRAQSASELAIFGAILIFVIGLIVRQGLNQSHHTNIRLRAMRMALDESYRTAEGQYHVLLGGGNRFVPSASRNTAAILVIEDRLSVDMADKYATRERAPFVASASGTFSRNLFMPVDWQEYWNLPIYDVFINGQRFPFSLGAFRTVVIDDQHPFWEPECIDVAEPGFDPIIRGCALFYKKLGNFPNAEHEWCAEADCSENMNVDNRFDLDRSGTLDDGEPGNPPDIEVPCGYSPTGQILDCPLREVFNWQWYKVAGIHHSVRGKLILEEPGVNNPKFPGVDIDKNINLNVDVDGDGQDEQIYDIVTEDGVITRLQVLDNQAGDLDFSGDRVNEKGRQAGLREDVLMYSFTKAVPGSGEGTYLRIQEGKLYGPDGQFIRHTNRQEHADIVMRIFDLSNDTGRFCQNGQPAVWENTPGLMGLKNPVEACTACFTTNIEKTCMMPEELIIFIRSRIQDLRGNRWVTRFIQQ